jgi:hypothetical protein
LINAVRSLGSCCESHFKITDLLVLDVVHKLRTPAMGVVSTLTDTLAEHGHAGAQPMAPADAMWYWLATKFATDQFMVFVFAGTPASVQDAVDEVIGRARSCPDLGLRVRRRNLNLRFPEWDPGPVEARQVAIRQSDGQAWPDFLGELARLMDDQLDPRADSWRLHVFPSVHGAPRAVGESTVVVLQITHALGDGTRTADLAGVLFGRDDPPAPVVSRQVGKRVQAVLAARRAAQQLASDTEAGAVPPAKPAVPPLSTNNRPTGRRILRTIAHHPDELPGPTVLVGALVAVSEALSGYLRERGEDVSALTAEVPTVKPGERRARNHITAEAVGLYPDAGSQAERLRLIVGDLMNLRRRNQHPALAAADLAFDAIPAPLRRLGVWRLDADQEVTTVQGNTVVSVVDRGAADLSFGGCPVLLTSSYPSLMPMLGLAHGVHRIGDSVAISVHTTDTNMPDVDDYIQRLEAAIAR